MFMKPNKIYAKINDANFVTEFFSSVFKQPSETDIFIEEGYEDYHAHVQIKYHVRDELDRLNFKFTNGQLVKLNEEEKDEITQVTESTPGEELSLQEQILKETKQNSANIEFIAMNSGLTLL